MRRLTPSIKPLILIFSLLGLAACTQDKEPPKHSRALVEMPVPGPRQGGSGPSEQGDRVSTTSVPASQVLGSDDSNLLALSAEEAAWLSRHGYPTPEEMKALMSYDVEALESAMRDGRDAKAAALLGHRRLLNGDIDGAVYAFGAGTELGSLYARQQLAIASTQRITGLPVNALSEADQGNLQVMIAQLEVAKMLGDHRAQAYIDKFASNFDWQRYGKHVLTQTAEFMRQYGDGARARGERPLGPDPRPNAEAWSRLQSDPYATVTVYRRDGTPP